MTDVCLTPFKRRFVENWRKAVQKHLDDGSICRIVVAQIEEEDDEVPVETPSKPQECPPTPKGDRARSRPIHREKSASEKLAELAVNSSLHIKALPSVNFTYTNANEHKMNTANIRPKSKTRKVPDEERDAVEGSVEKQPIVIVDPQLLTPSGHHRGNLSHDQHTKNVEKSVKFPLRITSVSKPSTDKYNKNRLPLFAKCKIHSSDQNSFVVSRSNLLKKGNLQNHSFLTLPVRFQVQSQGGERLTRNSTETLIMERERSPAPSFRNTGVRLIKKLSNINNINNITTLNAVRNSPRLMAW